VLAHVRLVAAQSIAPYTRRDGAARGRPGASDNDRLPEFLVEGGLHSAPDEEAATPSALAWTALILAESRVAIAALERLPTGSSAGRVAASAAFVASPTSLRPVS
jgi:hypothetical protein